jgi:hypothetical protein
MLLRKEISFGNLLSVATVLVAAAVAWGTMSTRVTGTEVKVGDIDGKVEKTRNDITEMKTTVGRMDERMKGMERSMDKQEQMMQQIIQKLK